MTRKPRDFIRVGAVSYHPRVVTIWETFVTHFEREGVRVDYVLYSNYERLVDALLERAVDIAWNTNTAFVTADHYLGHRAQILGMRDVDADFATVLVGPARTNLDDVTELRGRVIALGSRDSGHAAILPLYYLAKEGLDVAGECTVVQFDTDLGKHGDTGNSEMDVVRAVADGLVDVGALGDATWARMVTEGMPATADLTVLWRSPTYYHCNFTALPTFDETLAEQWLSALLAMNHNDPMLRNAMDLEGVKRWLKADRSGYIDLRQAMKEQGYIR